MDSKKSDMLRCDDLASMDLLLDVAVAIEQPWWTEEELGQILQHQLEAPLLFDLRRCQTAMPDHSAIPEKFGDLLFGRNPPLPLLQLLKEFAKSSDSQADNPLPPPVATVLYYGAILAARIRYAEQISALSEQQFQTGVCWVLRQKWIDSRTRAFFQVGLESRIKPCGRGQH